MRSKVFAAFVMIMLSMFFLSGGAYARLGDKTRETIDEKRMKNVSYSSLPSPPAKTEAVECFVEDAGLAAAVAEKEENDAVQEPVIVTSEPVIIDSRADEVLKTTISGGITVKNETAYTIDPEALADAEAPLHLKAGVPQVLIIHTHSSEAYTQAGLDRYEESDSFRTEDSEFNIIRIGDELTALFEQAGLGVIHDRGVYDYPSYTGSYTRSGEAIQAYLREYPDIAVVLDVHRDALGSDGVVFKTMAEESGTCASQLMLLVGTDESGLEHPHWRRNLALALYLQEAVSAKYPTLMRPVALVPQRYNQQLTTGSLILEVGSSGNTLQEALAGIRLFAAAAGEALLRLTETA